MKPEKPFELEVKATRIVFDDRYVWTTDPTEQYSSTEQYKIVSSVDTEVSYGSDDAWFAFFAEDCFDPSIHMIRAPSFEAAYYQFVEQEAERGHYVIDENDPDYGPDDGTYADHGVRVDTERFQGFEISNVVITSK